jgi:RNA polymerase sigma-32 factor
MLLAVDSAHVQRSNRRFIRQSLRAPLLTRAREIELARRWRAARDDDALHELVSAHARLVLRAASRYRKFGLALGDLMQEGLIGLLLAAARFDPDRGARFSTYAGWWVRSVMQDYILRNWSVVRTGTTTAQKALFFNLGRLRAQIDGAHAGPLTAEGRRRIAAELKVRIADVEAMESRLAANDQSLNAPLGDDGGERQDLLVDPGPSPEEIAIETRDAEIRGRWLAAALAELTARERKIVGDRRLRDDSVALAALGRRFGISKERVRQIEHRALAKIKLSIGRQSGALTASGLFGG